MLYNYYAIDTDGKKLTSFDVLLDAGLESPHIAWVKCFPEELWAETCFDHVTSRDMGL